LAGPRTLILVDSAEARDELSRLARTLPAANSRDARIEVVSGELEQAISTCREREGDAPLGFLAPDEPSVLAALSAGADESIVLEKPDTASLTAFIDRLELRARLRVEAQRWHVQSAHAEKLAALGTLVAGVGHEINNPLSAVILCLDALRGHLLPALAGASELVEYVEAGRPAPPELLAKVRRGVRTGNGRQDSASIVDDMSEAANAIASIVRDLRVFARTDDDEPPELVNVCELVDHVLRLLGRDLFKHGVLERDYASDLPLLVIPPNRVTQVVMNLLINATHAISEVTRSMHHVRVSVRADDDFLAIAVSDTGPGIPPASLERIFDPFFTTKRQDVGTGLGLSISRSILRKLGGDISVESVHGEGATFICLLPLPTQELMRGAPGRYRTGTFSVLSSRSSTVMVVDDDPRMLRSYARLLNAEHRIVIAHDGRDAIEALESGSRPDVAVIEIDLPGNDGLELLEWIDEKRPQLARRVLIVTSADGDPRYADFLESHQSVVLKKPVSGEALLHAVGQLVRDA
jgi:signal transduction histidine kinase/CheY-like chemotaxis protein